MRFEMIEQANNLVCKEYKCKDSTVLLCTTVFLLNNMNLTHHPVYISLILFLLLSFLFLFPFFCHFFGLSPIFLVIAQGLISSL